jgi:hypothetical protein
MIWSRRTMSWVDSSLYSIVSLCGLDDSMVGLDELLGVAGAIILVDMPDLEFIWPDNLLEQWIQSTETAPP